MKKNKSPLGTYHNCAIKRVDKVPPAAKGFPNATPGNTDRPILRNPETGAWKEKGK